jgi:hypothetical protein
MSQTSLGRVGIGLIVLLCFSLYTAWGQEKDVAKRPKPDEVAKTKRLAYVVQHGSAKDLATILGKHFKGEAEVQALPDSLSNLLLINAPAAVFDEVVKLLPQIDRRPETVVVEVLIAAISPKNGDGKVDQIDKDLDVKEFNGPAADVLAKLRARQGKGQIGTLRRLQFTLVEGRPSSVLLGEQKPFATSVNITAAGRVSKAITYRTVGTQLRATAHVSPEKKVEIDLDLNESGMVPDKAIVLGKDETGAPIYAMDLVTSRLAGKVNVASGQAIAAESVQTTSKSNKEQSLVIVTARIVDPNAKPEPEEPVPPVRPRRPNPRPGQPSPFLEPGNPPLRGR